MLKEKPAISPHNGEVPGVPSHLVSLLLLVSFVSCFQSRGGTNWYGCAYKAGGPSEVNVKDESEYLAERRPKLPGVCERLEGSPGEEKIGSAHVLSI